MTDQKHTPLPWKIKYYGCPELWSIRGEHITTVDRNVENFEINEANAAFIVKACNSYYDMIEHLQTLAESANQILNGTPDRRDYEHLETEMTRAFDYITKAEKGE